MKEARIIIAGSRDFNDYEYLKEELTQFIANHPNRQFTIVSGAARGADRLGERFARENNISVKRFPAEWDKLGRGAGYIRNAQMLDYISRSDCAGYVIAFWDGKSRGTMHTVEYAKKLGKPVRIVLIQDICK